MIPANRQEQYDSIVKKVKADYYYPTYQKEWDRLLFYLENENEPVPFHMSRWDSSVFSDIPKLIKTPDKWERFDERIMEMLIKFWKTNTNPVYLSIERVISHWIYGHYYPNISFSDLYTIESCLRKYNISEGYLCNNLLYFIFDKEEITASGHYILNNLDKLFKLRSNITNSDFFKLLLKNDEQNFDKYINHLIVSLHARGIDGFNNIPILLQHNPLKYEAFIRKVFKEATQISETIQIALLLDEYFPQKYNSEILTLSYQYLELIKPKFAIRYSGFESCFSLKKGNWDYTINIVFAALFEKELYDKAFNVVLDFVKECPFTSMKVIQPLYDRLGEKSFPILIESLGKINYDYTNPESGILNILKLYSHDEYYPQIWEFTRHNTKKVRSLAAQHLVSMMGEAAIPNAQKLLDDKKGDIRLAGALILSLIKTEKSAAILRGLLDREKNDDARDAMLEGLGDLINAETNRETVQDAIHQAKNRGKLDKPLMAWLVSSDFPTLYEQSGDPLSKEAVDFLFYRMNRTKDIRIDAEAKPLLAQIDKSKSAPFAKVLLKKYFENGADAKLKWCMTLGSILGSDDEMDTIKRKVNEWAEASRGKMAEYAVKALALNGSTKALRAVEFFSRKYKSKNKNIGAAAIESFSIAAEELGITPYDLADSIIPDFGFDGLFKEFEAEGETYRAFINNDFKLAFLNEDNRLLKALPKGTSAALKEEFKEIGKEVRDIVKSQSSRLEQYLVIQRKWSVEKWDTFFRGNPIMFAYAVRVIWAIFDEKQQIITTFQCLEDQTLVNVDGDELDLDDYTEGYQIGMVHPIDLTQETINHWKQALADADVQPIFPQLDRLVIAFKESDRHLTLSNEFNGIHYGGYGFVSKMEKLGWFRGSVVDAGGISSYYKDFSELGITAIIMQNGCIGVGYYEENAELGDLMFVRPKSVKFGSYSYNEPNKREDERLIPFGEVPQIVYSEVMADMLFFKENQIKKEEK